MTSNAGASRIIEPKRLGFGVSGSETEDYEYMKNGVMEEVRRIFKPEFLNRIDETIVFHALNKGHMGEIVDIMMESLVKRTKAQMGIALVLDETARAFIIDKGYDQKYGARPLRRTIQSQVEDKLAEEILDGTVGKGDTVTISAADEKLLFTRGK